jgi:hypothetical protein
LRVGKTIIQRLMSRGLSGLFGDIGRLEMTRGKTLGGLGFSCGGPVWRVDISSDRLERPEHMGESGTVIRSKWHRSGLN